jgi:hypothetical protein
MLNRHHWNWCDRYSNNICAPQLSSRLGVKAAYCFYIWSVNYDECFIIMGCFIIMISAVFAVHHIAVPDQAVMKVCITRPR